MGYRALMGDRLMGNGLRSVLRGLRGDRYVGSGLRGDKSMGNGLGA